MSCFEFKLTKEQEVRSLFESYSHQSTNSRKVNTQEEITSQTEFVFKNACF